MRAIFILCNFFILFTATAFGEHVVWLKKPIQITLPIGKERLINFQQSMSLGYDNTVLPAQALRIENDNKTLYLLAKQAFSTQRFQAKLADGHVVLLDINAKPSASDDAINIVLPQQTQNNIQTPQKNITTIDLTRFAIQQLYAPARLLTNLLS